MSLYQVILCVFVILGVIIFVINLHFKRFNDKCLLLSCIILIAVPLGLSVYDNIMVSLSDKNPLVESVQDYNVNSTLAEGTTETNDISSNNAESVADKANWLKKLYNTFLVESVSNIKHERFSFTSAYLINIVKISLALFMLIYLSTFVIDPLEHITRHSDLLLLRLLWGILFSLVLYNRTFVATAIITFVLSFFAYLSMLYIEFFISLSISDRLQLFFGTGTGIVALGKMIISIYKTVKKRESKSTEIQRTWNSSAEE